MGSDHPQARDQGQLMGTALKRRDGSRIARIERTRVRPERAVCTLIFNGDTGVKHVIAALFAGSLALSGMSAIASRGPGPNEDGPAESRNQD